MRLTLSLLSLLFSATPLVVEPAVPADFVVATTGSDDNPGTEAKPFATLAWARDAVRKLNGCAATGSPWGERCTIFPSASGTPVVEFIHPGGHEYPKGANAAIVRFFKEHKRSE